MEWMMPILSGITCFTMSFLAWGNGKFSRFSSICCAIVGILAITVPLWIGIFDAPQCWETSYQNAPRLTIN